MTDVARLAGVSQTCVSLVLNDAPGARLPETTRRRVREAAQRLGYRLPGPARASRSLASARSSHRVIAFVVDEISVSPHPVLQIDGARDAAWTAEHVVQTYVTRAHRPLEAATIAAIRQDPAISGVIYSSSFLRKAEPPKELDEVPTVLLGCYTSAPRYPTLLPDEVAGGFAATQYLIAYQHRRIGMIGGERWMEAAQHRLKGYREALEAADIPFDSTLVRAGDWSAASGYRHALDLMQLDPAPTALFCANDMMALGCLQALSELGLSVPHDVSIVGYNDLEMARHIHPPLSSCRLPSYALGQQAVALLLEMAHSGRRPEPGVTRVECQLVVRSSVTLRKGTRRNGAHRPPARAAKPA